MKKLNFFLSLILAVFFISCVSASVSVAGGFNGNLHDVSETIQPGNSIMFVSVFTAMPRLSDYSVNLPSGISEDSKSCASVSQYTSYCNYTISSSSQGIYNIRLTGTDSQGNVNSTYLYLKVNPTTPVNSPPIISPIANQYVNENSSYSYQVSASDPDGDALTYSISSNPSAPWLSINPSTGEISGTAPSVNSDAVYNIVVSVSDGHHPLVAAGYALTVRNVAQPSVPDTANPTIILNSPADNKIVNQNSITFSGLVYDNVEVKNVTIFTNGSVLNATDISGRNDTYYNFTATFPDGVYSWHYEACDTSGNCAISPARTFVVDTTAPTINLGAVTENGNFSDNNVIFGALVQDNYAVANVSLLLSGVVNQTDYSGLNNSDYSFPLTSLADGHYTWSIRACDVAGNCVDSSQHNFTVDTTSPAIEFESPTPANNAYIKTQTLGFNLTSSDSLSGLASTTVYLYNSSGFAQSSSSLSSSFSGLADGIYYLNATAVDRAGNSNSTGTRKITVDTAAPSISFVSPSNNSVLDHSYISVDVTASDTNLKNITARLYDSAGSYITQATSTFSPLASTIAGLSNGVYYINATAYDLVGNSKSTGTIKVTINSTSSGGSGSGSSGNNSGVTVSYSNVFTPAQEQINQTAPGISLGSQSFSLSASDYLPWVLLAAVVALLAGIIVVVLIRKK